MADRTNLKELYFHIKGTANAEKTDLGSSRTNYLKAVVYYDKGGYSYFTYKNRPRGYYISINPIGRGTDSAGHWESYSLFSGDGVTFLLSEVTKKSKKKDMEAIEYFDSNIISMINHNFSNYEVELEVA